VSGSDEDTGLPAWVGGSEEETLGRERRCIAWNEYE